MKNFKVMMMTLMMCLTIFSCKKENIIENKVPCESYEVYDFSDNALPNTDNTVLYLTTNLNLFSVGDSLILKPTEKSPPLLLFTNNRLIIENIENSGSLNTVKEVALTINLNFEELLSDTLYKNYVEQHGRLQFTLDLYCN